MERAGSYRHLLTHTNQDALATFDDLQSRSPLSFINRRKSEKQIANRLRIGSPRIDIDRQGDMTMLVAILSEDTTWLQIVIERRTCIVVGVVGVVRVGRARNS